MTLCEGFRINEIRQLSLLSDMKLEKMSYRGASQLVTNHHGYHIKKDTIGEA